MSREEQGLVCQLNDEEASHLHHMVPLPSAFEGIVCRTSYDLQLSRFGIRWKGAKDYDGRGYDVALKQLAGELLLSNSVCIAPLGRIIHIG